MQIEANKGYAENNPLHDAPKGPVNTMKHALLAIAAASLVAATGPSYSQAKPKQAAAAQQDEARAVVRAFRAIDSKTASGIAFADYSREVGELAAAVDALDERLERRKDQRTRDTLARTMEPYQQAKDLWSLCISGDECSYGLIAMGLESQSVVKYTASLLQQYPSMNAAVDQGGVFIDSNRPGRIMYSRLLSALWLVGRERSKALRASIQPD